MKCKACDKSVQHQSDPMDELCLECLEIALDTAGVKMLVSDTYHLILEGERDDNLDLAIVLEVEDELLYETEEYDVY